MHYLLLTILTLLPAVALAQDTEFVPLVGIPFVDTSKDLTLGDYVNGLYLAAISIAAFLAVVKIIFAGVQYMLSEVVTDKAQAKKSIYGAIIGLLIVLGAFLILNTINPNLTNLTNLDGPTLQTEGGNTNFEFVTEFDQVCDSVGGSADGCDRVTCETFDSQNNDDTFMGWVAWGSGYNALTTITDRALNSASCEVKCNTLGGDRRTEWTSSGECIFPTNPEGAKRNVLQTETEALKDKYPTLQDLPTNTIAIECSDLGRGDSDCGGGENICDDVGASNVETTAGGRVVTCTLP